jgi:hypothetical protein
MGEKPARDDEHFHVFVADDDIATRQEGINVDGNANFHGHVDLFDFNLHPFHQPDLEHCKCFF